MDKIALRTTHTTIAFFYIILSLSLFHVCNGVFSEDISEAIIMKQMEKTTHLHFFFQDIHSGKNPSAVRVAAVPGSSNLDDGTFGDTYVVDNMLTETEDPSSTEVGRAQGMYTFSDWKESGLLMVFNLQFTYGEFNGSGLTMVGRNPIARDLREMPIVGGTGRFRYATGYALANTVWGSKVTGDADVEYHVYVKYYY